MMLSDTPQPVWLKTLEQQTKTKSQKKIGAEIGYSPAVVNQVLSGKYKGDVAKVEAAIRGAYMGETVGCPVSGEISTTKCQSHQKAKFAATNPTRVRLYRACRNGCAHSTLDI